MNASLPQGFAGFIKAMAHEYPEHKLASIQFEANINEKTFAKIVTDELTTKETIVELYYSGEERFVLMPTIEPIEIKGSKKPLPLDNDSVVVVTGGAQGITPYIISRMAKEHNCHYLLLGRTEMVENDNEYAAFETIEEIKKQIIEEKVMTKPKEILNEATRIFKSLSIVKALAQIEEAGGKATYMRVDITCEEEFEKALKEIKEKFGSIDGLVHGAGILEDKLFVNKGYESFARVYDTKVRPVKTVLANLLPELKLLVLFSSMASAFGNDGQCDYSAGNNVLDQTAMMLKSQQADLHVVAFDWGPWIGAGMVNPALERKFRKQGIGFVELEKGADFLLNELAYGNEASVLAIAGDVKQIEEVIATVYPKTQ
jgi:NAD(P)-dependent dehydrogenase (short-subunit alcohol dehydrogenase family)